MLILKAFLILGIHGRTSVATPATTQHLERTVSAEVYKRRHEIRDEYRAAYHRAHDGKTVAVR